MEADHIRYKMKTSERIFSASRKPANSLTDSVLAIQSGNRVLVSHRACNETEQEMAAESMAWSSLLLWLAVAAIRIMLRRTTMLAAWM